VTFVSSLLERVIEEQARGDASKAEGIRKSLQGILGDNLAGIVPGSAEAERVKQATGDAAQVATAAVTDAAITTGIKAKLFADAQLKARDIHVETRAGLAALHGTVPDEASRGRAAQLAAAVQGVTGVDNQLTVAP